MLFINITMRYISHTTFDSIAEREAASHKLCSGHNRRHQSVVFPCNLTWVDPAAPMVAGHRVLFIRQIIRDLHQIRATGYFINCTFIISHQELIDHECYIRIWYNNLYRLTIITKERARKVGAFGIFC
jgi:hypothetical protein